MPPAVILCAEPDVLRGLVQPKLSNQPSPTVQMSTSLTRTRCPRHHNVQKRASATKTK